MKKEIVVPPVGESITQATVASLLKTSGSTVQKDEEIIELETDKVNQVIYAPESGILTLTVSADQVVKVGEVIGSIETSGEAIAPKQEEKTAPAKETPPPKPAASSPPPQGQTIRVTPENFVSSLDTPPQKVPIPAPEKPKIPSSPNQERKKMSGLRKTIARRLVEVKNQTAMLTTFNEVDMTEVMEIRAREKEAFEKKHGVKLGFMSFFVKAVSSALKEIPEVNAFIDGDEIVYNKTFDIGISVSTEKGLMVPVLRDCANKTFAEIEKGIVAYAKKAREGSISIDDMQGGTFTITNGGTFGSLLSTPIINPPQSAILGMHNIVKRPIALNDNVVIRPMMYIALSYDHRIIDGKEAVTFLVKIKQLLEEPSRLLLDF